MIREGRSPEVQRLINDILEYQLAMMSPRNFDTQDENNIIKAMEISFENVCTTLEELGISDPYNLTVFSFYSKIAYFEKKNKK